MTSSIVTRSNPFFRATFNPQTGNLLQLLPADGSLSLIQQVFIQYGVNGQLYCEGSDNPLANAPEIVRVQCRNETVTSVLRTPHLEINRSFQIAPFSPVLRIRYDFTGTTTATLHGPGILYFQLAADLNDVTRDKKDLYFDGAELGNHREIPCWRVLFRKGYRRGVLVATRSKWQMSHVMYNVQTLELRPHVYSQQQLNWTKRDIPIEVTPGRRYMVKFEIGPWRSSQHEDLIRAAELEKPVRTQRLWVGRARRVRHGSGLSARPAVAPYRQCHGEILWVADRVPRRAATTRFHLRKWLRVGLPWNRRRKTLLCNAGCRPPEFVIKPATKGPCRVFVGGSKSASVGLQFSGDPYPVYRVGLDGSSFHSVLYGADQSSELFFGIVDMTDRSIRVVPNHNGHWPTRLDYVRLEPLRPAEAREWRQRQASPFRAPLTGIHDINDVFFYLLDRNNLDPRLVEGNLWEQARLGFKRVYWQMHGTYTGFHTKIGTRIPMVCKGHGAFEPQIKGGPMFHRKHDVLRLAVNASKKLGIELWGASRMNAYMSGKRDEFFQKHPQFAEISEDGITCENKICYAIPEVRDYQRSILVEAAQYGLPGLMLGFLRHPPMFLYHPVLVGGYRARYGKLPPRDLGAADPYHKNSLPESEPEYLQWYAYRAEFMTQFGRDLKRDLRAKGLGHVKISLWLRPNHCLFDGINVEDWLREELCDEIIADIDSSLSDPLLDEPRSKWRKMVQAKVPLLKGLGGGSAHFEYAAKNMERYLTEGYAGFCVYASEQFGQTAQELRLLELLRGKEKCYA